MEEEFKKKYGYIKFQKGVILYYLSEFNEINFEINYNFYFHPSEACVRKFNYNYLCKYEVIQDIELPIILKFNRNYSLNVYNKVASLLIKNKHNVNIGWLSCTPSGHGLEIFIPNPHKYLNKIDNIETIRFDYNTYQTYKLYLHINLIEIKMNNKFKNEINKYINYYKESNWENSFINMIDIYNIDYFEDK